MTAGHDNNDGGNGPDRRGEPGPASVAMAAVRREGVVGFIKKIHGYGLLASLALAANLMSRRQSLPGRLVNSVARPVLERALIAEERRRVLKCPPERVSLSDALFQGGDPMAAGGLLWFTQASRKAVESGCLWIDCPHGSEPQAPSRIVEAHLALEQAGTLKLDFGNDRTGATERSAGSAAGDVEALNRPDFESAMRFAVPDLSAPSPHRANRFMQLAATGGGSIAVLADGAAAGSSQKNGHRDQDEWIRDLASDLAVRGLSATLYVLDQRIEQQTAGVQNNDGDGSKVSNVSVVYPRDFGLGTYDLLALASLCDAYVGCPSLFAAATCSAGGVALLTSGQPASETGASEPPGADGAMIWLDGAPGPTLELTLGLQSRDA